MLFHGFNLRPYTKDLTVSHAEKERLAQDLTGSRVKTKELTDECSTAAAHCTTLSRALSDSAAREAKMCKEHDALKTKQAALSAELTFTSAKVGCCSRLNPD